MRLYRYPTDLGKVLLDYNGCVLSFGNFDGLHIGHQKIISKVNERARSLKLPSVLLNFYPHPLKIIKGDNVLSINSVREKSNLLRTLAVDYLYMYRFNTEVRKLKANEFLDLLITKLNPKEVYVGEDASIGVNREGDVNFMTSYFKSKNINFGITEFISSKVSEKVSSSNIRNYISKGNFELLNEVLGRRYSISGRVKKGKQIARKSNFKTANINCKSRLTPKYGVYLTKTIVDGKILNSISNVGVKPTYGSSNPLLETHIFDYDTQDFYGTSIEVIFLKHLRDEIKFKTPSELKKQILQDCELAKALHDE